MSGGFQSRKTSEIGLQVDISKQCKRLKFILRSPTDIVSKFLQIIICRRAYDKWLQADCEPVHVYICNQSPECWCWSWVWIMSLTHFMLLSFSAVISHPQTVHLCVGWYKPASYIKKKSGCLTFRPVSFGFDESTQQDAMVPIGGTRISATIMLTYVMRLVLISVGIYYDMNCDHIIWSDFQQRHIFRANLFRL